MWWFAEGDALDDATREKLEESAGVDFGDVRIHRQSELARAMSAEAFTSGRDVYFAPGRYGESLLEHELTHVVQQSRGGPRADAAHEREAEGGRAVTGAKAGAVQRQPMSGSSDTKLDEPPETIILDDFDTNQSVLKPMHAKRLDDIAASLAAALVSYPSTFVSIIGHTDAVDAFEHNLQLGQRRADAVRDYIVGKGVPRSVMLAWSLGESLPAVPTQQAEKRNRRVEMIIHKHAFSHPPLLDLTKPPMKLALPSPPPPNIDLRAQPAKQLDQSAWKKANEILEQGKGRSVEDVFGDAARKLAASIGLSKKAQERAESFGRTLPKNGVKAVLKEISKTSGLDPATKSALDAVIEELSKQQEK